MEQKLSEKETMCCDILEVHEDLLKIVQETMPEETELYDLAELLRYSVIPPESGSCLYCLKLRSASVTLLRLLA